MLSRTERLALLDWKDRELPIKTQAELLGLNRSGLYYKSVPPSPEEVALKREIDEIFTECPYYGSRRVTAVLRRRGWTVNRKAVQRHMREMGLEAVYPGPNLSRRNQEHRVYPYLLRGLTISAPGVGHGYHLYPTGTGMAVPGGTPRLVLPVRRELGLE